MDNFTGCVGLTCSLRWGLLKEIVLLARWCWSLRAWRWSFSGQLVTCPTSTWLAMLLWRRLLLVTWSVCKDLFIQTITGWCDHFQSQSEVYFKNVSKCFRVFCFCRFVRQCLNFLSALVSQGPEAAREVLSSIYINKALSGLAKRKDKKVCGVCLFHFSGCVGLVWLCRYACVSLNCPGKTWCPHGFYPVCVVLPGVWRHIYSWPNTGSQR